MVVWLALLFGLVALAYASVGFGGGSTYNALLAISGVQYHYIPIIALVCNIVVVTGGTVRYGLAGKYEWRRMLPLVAIAAPAAFMGGLTPINESFFYLLLGSALLFSAAAMLIPTDKLSRRELPVPVLLGLSGIIGFVAGLSGIGGGIFIAPFLHLVRWAEAQRVAAFASFFILVNSVAGLGGQLAKSGISQAAEPFGEYWPLLLAVLIGGQLGGVIGLKLFNAALLRNLTAILVAYVALRLLWQGGIAM